MALDTKASFQGLEAMTASDIMTTDVVSVDEQDSVVVAGHRMRERHISHLPVLRGERVVGVVDDVVLAETISRLGWSELEHPVAAVMHREVVRVHPQTPLRDVAIHLGYSRCGVAVVTQENRLVGIVTKSDVVAAVAQAEPTQP